MSSAVAHGSTHGAHGSGAPNALSVPWVLLASILMGVGIFLISAWLITFNLLYSVGVFVVLAGFLMTFDPRMGSDHA